MMRVLPIAVLAALPCLAQAHGVVGQRFFPATIATEDPFVADELSLPTVTRVRTNESDEEPRGRRTTIEAEFSKRITDKVGLSIGLAHQRFSAAGEPSVSGYENTELGLKYQLYRDEQSETLLSAGLAWEIGGSGSRSVAERASTYTPTVFFGKGFGDVSAPYLRPLAATGSVGIAMPTHVLQLGLALHYSIPYLQSAVKDVGFGAPFDKMIPIVEVALEKPLRNTGERGWTGTVNPGVLWAGKKMQVGIEAVVPVNRRSGRSVGAQAQLHFFLDDLFPSSLGRPLGGSAR
jgi:hypothetical protein